VLATLSTTAIAMCTAGILVFVTGLWSSKAEIAALHRVCFAIPIAVFGALHLFAPEFIEPLVPKVMPWRMVWVYGIGCALLAASLSIATGRAVRWSGFLFGLMMLLFVLILFIPGALRHPGDRMGWTFVCRESSFGGAAWMLAAAASDGWPTNTRRVLLGVGRALVIPALLLFGVEQILHPTLLPGVPLRKEMPEWVPARTLIDYVTGAALLVAGGSVLLNRKTRRVAGWVGAWLVLLVLVIYGPVMILALARPETAVQVEGINYFADTLLFAGVILVLSASEGSAFQR
jgi:uncharacterized membrane protein